MKQMLLVLNTFSLLAVGCGKGPDGKIDPLGDGDFSASAAKYSWIKTNVLEKSCVTCHGAGPKVAGHVNLTSYKKMMESIGDESEVPPVTAGDPDHSPLCTEIRAGEMPKKANKLSQDVIDAVCQWIKDGALED